MQTLRFDTLPDPWVPRLFYDNATTLLGITAFGAGTLVASNNDAHYVPVTFPCDAVLYAIRFAGANATGNYDLGFYDAGLNRIASSGSQALSAAVKSLTLPELRVRAGETYYGALALSNTLGQIVRPNFSLTSLKGFGWGMEASALPLPSTATPVSTTAYSVVPYFAFGIR